MSYRRKLGLIGLIITGVFLTFMISCDTEKHHKTLSIFFDGVPPLETETITTEGEASQGATAAEFELRRKLVQPKQTGSEHEPLKSCASECHGERKKRRYSQNAKLMQSVPALCYSCHTDYTVSADYVHGPVVVGDCLFCHDPHRSNNKNLLKKPVPELCYQCHEQEVVETIPEHIENSAIKCNDCHDGHASSEKLLLKADWKNNLFKNEDTPYRAETTE